ncbi:MAG TPA: hypothetical protein VN903_36135, partial [Polyangia bacterium]|nr:hypothetical protein [Polyangia bacterium]
SAATLYATDVTSPWLFAGLRVRTTAVIEDCARTDFRASYRGYSRRIDYRFDAAGASWRSSSYEVRRRCPLAGQQVAVEYPLGFPSLSRLRTMDRHPLPEDVAPLLIAIALYALAGLVASFVAAAREIRFLRRGRITLAVFEESTPVNGSYGRSFYLLIYRVLVGGRRVQIARYKDTDADKSDRVQLVLYDPLCPARRRFTGLMGAENLSTFGSLDRRSFGGKVFIGIMLALALLLVFRAVRWTVLNHL